MLVKLTRCLAFGSFGLWLTRHNKESEYWTDIHQVARNTTSKYVNKFAT